MVEQAFLKANAIVKATFWTNVVCAVAMVLPRARAIATATFLDAPTAKQRTTTRMPVKTTEAASSLVARAPAPSTSTLRRRTTMGAVKVAPIPSLATTTPRQAWTTVLAAQQVSALVAPTRTHATTSPTPLWTTALAIILTNVACVAAKAFCQVHATAKATSSTTAVCVVGLASLKENAIVMGMCWTSVTFVEETARLVWAAQTSPTPATTLLPPLTTALALLGDV